jgi:surface polysaccharide O-acyltransferase-like enzyme
MKRRVLELDYVRALSMLAIIALHVSGAFVFAESAFKLFSMSPAFVINQLMRFAVPAFITLSGLSLGYSKACEPPLVFYKGRLSKALVPYIIWYAVYFAYNCFHGGAAFSAGAFFKGLLTGSAAPHLYFMVVIIQLYILFPALSRLLEKYKTATLCVSLALTLYFQSGIYIKYFSIYIIPRFLEANAWLLFPTWIFYFAAGIIISGSLDSITALAKKRLALIFALFLTNPAPICVLDEVDAPLDDANVERFCDLLDRMTEETDTRYLIVTHNAVTMSRMHRLYGVTMIEKGVSRLVSVDLGGAETLLAAE